MKYSACAECEIISLRKLWNISRRLRLCSMWNEINPPHAPQRISHAKRISRTKCISQIPQGIYFTEKSTCASKCFFLAGMAGFGPTNVGVKVLCLTAWRHPNNTIIISHLSRDVNEKSNKTAVKSKNLACEQVKSKKALTKNEECAILFRRCDRAGFYIPIKRSLSGCGSAW